MQAPGGGTSPPRTARAELTPGSKYRPGRGIRGLMHGGWDGKGGSCGGGVWRLFTRLNPDFPRDPATPQPGVRPHDNLPTQMHSTPPVIGKTAETTQLHQQMNGYTGPAPSPVWNEEERGVHTWYPWMKPEHMTPSDGGEGEGILRGREHVQRSWGNRMGCF